MFASAGDRDAHATMFLTAKPTAKQPIDFAMVAAMAEARPRRCRDRRRARSIDAGMPLMIHGYPVTALPSGGTPSTPLVFAIVRTESAFDQEAMSRVGARGLMQLMPGTAQLVAAQQQLPYSLDRLTSDGRYNLTLGRAYIEKLLDDFGGSYALAIAGLQRRPRRASASGCTITATARPARSTWSTGSRRSRSPRPAPMSSACLESLQIYRGQNTGNTAAFSLAADLAR